MVLLRSPFDDDAGWNIRVRQDEHACPVNRRISGSRCAAAARRPFRYSTASSPKLDRASDCDDSNADLSSLSSATSRIPFPPPPAEALSITGYPVSAATVRFFKRGERLGRSRNDRDAGLALLIRRADDLSAHRFHRLRRRPDEDKAGFVHLRTKAGFSERNP